MAKLFTSNSYLNHLLRNQLTSLILYERITTTQARGKRLKTVADKLLALAEANNLNSRRQAAKLLFDKKAVKKLFEVIAPKIKSTKIKTGGVRIFRLAPRKGDNAPRALVELLPALKTLNEKDVPPKPQEKPES